MSKIYRTNGTTEDVSPKNGTDFTLEELQDIVGGMIQLVYLGGRDVMVIDEEGKVNEPQKKLNKNATLIARKYLFDGDFIAGDALVCDTEMVK